MSFEAVVVIGIGIIVLSIALFIVWRIIPKRVKKTKFQKQWRDLQKYCKHKETWPTALIKADDLLDIALRRKRFKGRNMGERLVAAQKKFTDNDAVWFAHKLTSKLRDHPKARLKEKEVKDALISLGQAMKDIGVL